MTIDNLSESRKSSTHPDSPLKFRSLILKPIDELQERSERLFRRVQGTYWVVMLFETPNDFPPCFGILRKLVQEEICIPLGELASE